MATSRRWFEVRRRAQRQGHFQEERWGRISRDGGVVGDWRPIGTLAAEVLRRHGGRSGVVAELRARGVRVHAQMKARGVITLWRVALEAAVERGEAPDMQRARNVFPYWIAWVPPRGSRGEMVQSFFLPLNPLAGAISLSAALSMVSGSLWICRRCRQPFRRSSTARVCPDCHRVASLTTAAGISTILVQRVWRLFRKRLDLRVLRGRMTRKERDTQKRSALRDLREVDRKRISLHEWRQRWDRREK